jgi:aspartyl-tRNA(Asn)/glutamyl-tRNA(Gln) amidotransferase subunit B
MTQTRYKGWQIVIGLEIHSELNTKSKLFSAAPNHFGDEPNTNITEVCTGLPGSLPVLNQEAVKKAVQLGCALNAKVCTFSKFDRKSYFYPDSPRNFQITQMDEPIILGGTVTTEVDGEEKSFAINRVHIEDDAGMLKHFSSYAGVDYNRAGVPLLEIVSEPCIHSPQEAAAYAMAVKAIAQYIDISDCNMEEGSMRFDANISVRREGEEGLRPKVEIKNMNSFNFMIQALDAEIHRQVNLYEKNPEKAFDEVIFQSTYRWDSDKKENILMRQKEDADDYRYFPEPDLLPIILTESYIEEIRAALPELPRERELRYISDLGLSRQNAFNLVSEKEVSDYFEEALSYYSVNPKALCNWITSEFPGRLKEHGTSLKGMGIHPENLAKLVKMIDKGTITGRIAKQVADEMVSSRGKDSEEIVQSNPDYQPLSDVSSVEPIVDEVLAAHEQSVLDYKAGKNKALAFLVGQIMKKTRGKAPPQVVNELIRKKIK